MPVTEAYIEEIKRRIERGDNGDVDLMELALLAAIYEKVECIEDNPSIKFGEAVRNNKGLTAFLAFISWFILILLPQAFIQLMGWDHFIAP